MAGVFLFSGCIFQEPAILEYNIETCAVSGVDSAPFTGVSQQEYLPVDIKELSYYLKSYTTFKRRKKYDSGGEQFFGIHVDCEKKTLLVPLLFERVAVKDLKITVDEPSEKQRTDLLVFLKDYAGYRGLKLLPKPKVYLVDKNQVGDIQLIIRGDGNFKEVDTELFDLHD